MYGMVNRAIKQFIKEQHGVAVWERIASKADTHDDFGSMDQYPDSTSVDIIAALSEATGKTPTQTMTEIGEYWIDFAFNSQYGELLDMAGDTLPEVLSNLDDMYMRIGSSSEELESPSFWVTDLTEDSMILHYSSEIEGLAPMVVGLVRGLSKHLQTACSVIQVGFKGHTSEHDEFAIAFEKHDEEPLLTQKKNIDDITLANN